MTHMPSNNGSAKSDSIRPNLMIVTRQFGASGQPWIWRQVNGLRGFRKQVVCWKRDNRSTQPQTDFEEIEILEDPAPYDGDGRWRHRSRAAMRGNFYASVGRERRRLLELLEQQRPDVILCYFGDIAMRLVPAALAINVPLVAYLHGDFLFQTNRWYRWSLLRCLKHFAAVTVVTAAERDWLVQYGVPDDKVHVVPCGAPVNVFHPMPILPNSDIRFIMASRLSEEKGCHISITAFAKFAESFPDARLSVFGDGPQRPYLEELAMKRGLRGVVRFHGYVGEKELACQMAQHDVFIQHSLKKEGSPVSIVEAMLCGLPAISTRVGGISDLVVDEVTGIFVDEGDVEKMANAMRVLAQDANLRKRYGQAAMERAVVHFNADRQTETLGKILTDAYVFANQSATKFTTR